jgi:Cof subfamily protein (haloacid dehalogenase superfamily)
MRVEAVVADLDGTLVREDFCVSDATVHALDMIRAAHIPVVIATARTLPGLQHLTAVAERADVAVCCSGAIGWSRRQGRLWQEQLSPDTICRVVELAIDQGAGVASFDGELWRMSKEYAHLSPGQPHGPRRATVELAELASSPCSTMAVRRSGPDLANLAELLAGQTNAALSHVGHATVLDITPAGADKGTGARRALAVLDIDPSAAISFGDMPNDLSLFAATGRSYAVGNRHPTVVRAAHEVLESVEHDGFSRKVADLANAEWNTE